MKDSMEYRVKILYETDESGQLGDLDIDISDLYVEANIRIREKVEKVLSGYDLSDYFPIICKYIFKHVLQLIQDIHECKLKGTHLPVPYSNEHQRALVSLFNHFSRTGLLGELDMTQTGHFDRIFFKPTAPLVEEIHLFLVDEIRERLEFQIQKRKKELNNATA